MSEFTVVGVDLCTANLCKVYRKTEKGGYERSEQVQPYNPQEQDPKVAEFYAKQGEFAAVGVRGLQPVDGFGGSLPAKKSLLVTAGKDTACFPTSTVEGGIIVVPPNLEKVDDLVQKGGGLKPVYNVKVEPNKAGKNWIEKEAIRIASQVVKDTNDPHAKKVLASLETLSAQPSPEPSKSSPKRPK